MKKLSLLAARIAFVSMLGIFALFVGMPLAHAASLSIVSLEPGSTIAVGTPVTFSLDATGFNNPTYTLSDSFIDGSLGSYDLNSSGDFSWTPAPNDVGTHTLAITANDQSGDAATVSLVLNVTEASTATNVTTTVTAPVTTVTTTVPVTPVVPAYTFTGNLSVGSTGAEVTALQQVLTGQGDFTGTVTGYYGSLTEAAVDKFQAAHSIQQLGIVGPETLAALNAIETQEAQAATTTVAPTTTSTTAVSPVTLAEIQSEIQSISTSLSQVESQLSQLVGT